MSDGCGRGFSSRQKPVCHPPMSGPFELTAAFCTPGNARTLSSSVSANLSTLSRSLYFRHGNSKRAVKSARGSYPNDSDCSREKLFRTTPAATSKVRVSAISVITSPSRARFADGGSPLPAEPVFKASCTFVCEACHAGHKPKSTVFRDASKNVKPKTGQSKEICWNRDTSPGLSAIKPLRTQTAIKKPSAPPIKAI